MATKPLKPSAPLDDPPNRIGVILTTSRRPFSCQTQRRSATMGIMMSRLFENLFGSKEVRILILGLDNAGKTTILYRLQNESDEAVQTIPTIGFNVETLQYKNIKVRRYSRNSSNKIIILSLGSGYSIAH